MKKIIAICALALCLLFSSCGNTATVLTQDQISANETPDISMFIVVESSLNWRVVYHKQTKVMYVVSNGGYNAGTFTLLVNPDGTPMLFEEGQ